jgi:predicted nucleic acid-binding protein
MRTYWDSSALIEALHNQNIRVQINNAAHATRVHALREVFSTLTKGVRYCYPPQDAAKMAEDLAKDLDFVELTTMDTLAAINKARSQGVRGARIHDLMHAEAAAKYGADEILTLDVAGFGALKISQTVKAP